MQEITEHYTRSRELSIQVGLDGFSFVVFDIAPAGMGSEAILRSVTYRDSDMATILTREPMLTAVNPPINRVFIGYSTDQVLLIPQPLFEPERAEQYLTAANLYTPGMTTLTNNLLSGQAAAVWQADPNMVAGLLQLYPGALFYHPLLTICHDRLYAAETIPVDTPEELLYYIQKLIKHDGFTNYRLILTGEGAERLRSFFIRYFDQVDAREITYYNQQRVREICAS